MYNKAKPEDLEFLIKYLKVADLRVCTCGQNVHLAFRMMII